MGDITDSILSRSSETGFAGLSLPVLVQTSSSETPARMGWTSDPLLSLTSGLSDQRHTGNTKDVLSPQSSFWHTCEMRTHEPQGNTSINPGLLAELWERSFGSGPTQQTTTGPKSHDQTHLYRCLIGLYFTSHPFLFKLFLESFYDDVTTKSNR